MSNRPKRGWPFWFAVAVIALPMLYVGSFVPACWISSRVQPSGRAVSAIYSPVIRLRLKVPPRVRYPMDRVILWGVRKHTLTTNRDGRISF